jgi:hypothetical protein
MAAFGFTFFLYSQRSDARIMPNTSIFSRFSQPRLHLTTGFYTRIMILQNTDNEILQNTPFARRAAVNIETKQALYHGGHIGWGVCCEFFLEIAWQFPLVHVNCSNSTIGAAVQPRKSFY